MKWLPEVNHSLRVKSSNQLLSRSVHQILWTFIKWMQLIHDLNCFKDQSRGIQYLFDSSASNFHLCSFILLRFFLKFLFIDTCSNPNWSHLLQNFFIRQFSISYWVISELWKPQVTFQFELMNFIGRNIFIHFDHIVAKSAMSLIWVDKLQPFSHLKYREFLYLFLLQFFTFGFRLLKIILFLRVPIFNFFN